MTDTTPKNRHERRREATLLRRGLDPDSVPDEWMTRTEAAAYLSDHCGCPISVKTLAQYASRAHVEGPPYALTNSRAMYARSDLEKWADSRRSPKATSRAQHEDIVRQRERAA